MSSSSSSLLSSGTVCSQGDSVAVALCSQGLFELFPFPPPSLSFENHGLRSLSKLSPKELVLVRPVRESWFFSSSSLGSFRDSSRSDGGPSPPPPLKSCPVEESAEADLRGPLLKSFSPSEFPCPSVPLSPAGSLNRLRKFPSPWLVLACLPELCGLD